MNQLLVVVNQQFTRKLYGHAACLLFHSPFFVLRT